jgi:hypothetical protein
VDRKPAIFQTSLRSSYIIVATLDQPLTMEYCKEIGAIQSGRFQRGVFGLTGVQGGLVLSRFVPNHVLEFSQHGSIVVPAHLGHGVRARHV